MSKKKILHRFMSLLLAFCMALSMLPGQALAASASDDPSTWPAPDSKYTASGKNPVYVYLDYSTDEGIAAGHLCNVGASLNREIVQATATTSGYIKYTCSDCGSWAQINVPALPVSAFTLNSAYQSMIDNGVEYTGRSQTLVYDIASAYQRFVGASLTNNFNATNAGSYNVQITVASDIYDNVVHVTDETLVIKPKQIPWTTQFRDKIYDGTNALTGQTVSYTDVNGKTVNVPLKTYLITNSGGQPSLDKTSEVTAPIAAGFYGIWSEITDKNYVWSNSQGTTANVMTSVILVYPKADAIYVNDSASDVKLTTGSSTNASAYTWTVDNTYTGFDSSKPGTTNVQYKVARQSSGTAMADVAVSVTVKARSVLTVESVSRSAPLGTAFSQLNLPTTVSVTAEGGKTVTGVPVTWNSSGYNANTKSQTVTGTLNVSSIPELSSTNLPTPTAAITLSNNTATAPTISNYTKTYDGQSTALPIPTLPAGIQSASVTYSGTSNAGNAYSSSTPPTNAGTYTATVSFTMESGYNPLSNVTASYTINKAAQTCAKPALSSSTASSLTLNTVQNAEYSKDGTTWQTSPTFSNLAAGTSYTLYQRLKATSDGNYEESPSVSDAFTTKYNTAATPTISDFSKTYDGQSAALPLPTAPAGIQSMTVFYHGTSVSGNPYSSTNAPTNVGNYTATVSFVMENGYAQLPSAEVKYIIGKAAQNFPEPVLSYATTTTLTLVAVDNAEYSMDGQIWQDSPIFRNLDPGTTYTLYQRLKEDGSGNHEETPTTSGQFTTEYESAGELNLQAQTSPYTGSPISYKVPTVSLTQQITVVYTVGGSDTTTAPTNAGTYPVKVTFTMRPGAAQIEPVTTSLTITKINQNAPSAPKASNVGTNSCGNLHRNCDFLPRCEPYACLW